MGTQRRLRTAELGPAKSSSGAKLGFGTYSPLKFRIIVKSFRQIEDSEVSIVFGCEHVTHFVDVVSVGGL